DVTYQRARGEADRAYRRGDVDAALEADFVAHWPQLPDAEALARDYSTFDVRQRQLVTLLLREGRFRLAHAHGHLLFVHAGVTVADLAAIGSTATTAPDIAAALNAWLDAAVARTPFELGPVYQPGSHATGEARGMLAHRPSHPGRSPAAQFVGPPRRRFDPRELPTGVTQVIGHVRDGKCRELLGEWVEAGEPRDGPLRQLHVNGDSVRYSRGVSNDAALIFIDGGMNHTPIADYELFDFGNFSRP
ncbi:MAG: transcriptional regulator, partial [Myxococcaceae bacterium]|nr:transcriptional regulator [Myxococcaceae bacterium]